MLRSFGTLSVDGDLDLGGLHPSTSTDVDVTVRTIDSVTPCVDASWEWIDDTDSHLQRASLDGSTLVMEFDLDGIVRIRLDTALREICVHNEGNVDLDGIEHLVTNQALPLYASLVGLTVLHGSAVEIDGSAVIALGDSGAGKSTLAAYLVANGGRLLTDDSVVLELGSQHSLVYPLSRSVRLFDDSLDGAFPLRSPTTRVGAHTDKQQLRMTNTQMVNSTEPRPIRAIIELGQDTCHEPRLLSATQRLAVLDRSLIGLVAKSRAARQHRFVRLMDLLVAVPVWEIGMEWTPSGTRRSVDEILHLISTSV